MRKSGEEEEEEGLFFISDLGNTLLLAPIVTESRGVALTTAFAREGV